MIVKNCLHTIRQMCCRGMRKNYSDIIDQDGITLKRILHLIWITMETWSTLETLNKIFWILHFSTATYDPWPSCYNFRYVQPCTEYRCVVIIYLLRHCDAAWHGICQMPGDQLDSKPTFVLFHNDTRYTRNFKISTGIGGMMIKNIYQLQSFVKHSNSESIW